MQGAREPWLGLLQQGELQGGPDGPPLPAGARDEVQGHPSSGLGADESRSRVHGHRGPAERPGLAQAVRAARQADRRQAPGGPGDW